MPHTQERKIWHAARADMFWFIDREPLHYTRNNNRFGNRLHCDSNGWNKGAWMPEQGPLLSNKSHKKVKRYFFTVLTTILSEQPVYFTIDNFLHHTFVSDNQTLCSFFLRGHMCNFFAQRTDLCPFFKILVDLWKKLSTKGYVSFFLKKNMPFRFLSFLPDCMCSCFQISSYIRGKHTNLHENWNYNLGTSTTFAWETWTYWKKQPWKKLEEILTLLPLNPGKKNYTVTSRSLRELFHCNLGKFEETLTI